MAPFISSQVPAIRFNEFDSVSHLHEFGLFLHTSAGKVLWLCLYAVRIASDLSPEMAACAAANLAIGTR